MGKPIELRPRKVLTAIHSCSSFIVITVCFPWFQPLRYALRERLSRAHIQQPFADDDLRQEQKRSHVSRAKRAARIQVSDPAQCTQRCRLFDPIKSSQWPNDDPEVHFDGKF